MNKRLVLLLVILAMMLFVPAALAQSTTPATEEEGGPPPTAFVVIDLTAGYPLDPLIVSLNGGGNIPASVYGDTCSGFIPENPTVTLNWAGETDFVEAFFYSDHDPVLVVETPSGDYLCNDDANDLLLDPVLWLEKPEQGRYNIWVGSYAPNQLLPGLLVLTTRPEVNIGTFSLENLINREPIPEDLVEAEEINTGKLVTDTTTLTADRIVDWNSEEELTHTVTVSGTVPAFDISTPDMMCNGFIHTLPDFVFNLSETPDHLRIFFEGDGDATLMVEDPQGNIFCNDDHVTGENLNPVVDIPEATTGQYYVFIGRVQIDEEIHGVMTVSGSVELNPAILKGGE
ncbi:MAG: hypothetical protein KDE58_11895 [Caldilineaceae bacterium]|nr:hypothetical protein [Caldilineaceae bacterium]